MKTSEIRKKFLAYFQNKGHTVIESSSLIPANDPTLLFTNAGMVQFKDTFLGKEKRPYVRAVTTQKCVRAGGKHNDLENVGFTARHHTFFEMLGNFSFGDYFKKEAISFAYEFSTKDLKLNKDLIHISVFKDDDEAAELWQKQEGVPSERIHRFGEKDNFWAMGETGPCGPCSELYFDRGQASGCGKPTCTVGCECDRYLEFWNLVFMQYNRDSSGAIHPLPAPSVDTGAGLERLASILQNVPTNYDTDIFKNIIKNISMLLPLPENTVLADPEFANEVKFSLRVLADHARATTFLISDGVMPSNEARGYVLRRIMRRAIRHGKKLGFHGPFFHKIIPFVIDEMKNVFPDLSEKKVFLEKVTLAEEEQFFRTLDRGLVLIEEEMSKLTTYPRILDGTTAFKLYDTYGFPLDLTRVICEEKGISVDDTGFEKSMAKQKFESRKHWKGSGESFLDDIYLEFSHVLQSQGRLPEFTGHASLIEESECLGIFVSDPKENKTLRSVQEFKVNSLTPHPSNANSQASPTLLQVIFAKTPFYAESGGQVGDKGKVFGSPQHPFQGEVLDVQKPVPNLIVVTIAPISGELKVGAFYKQATNALFRKAIEQNHTATHLLHWALREVLGSHVKQSGSLVNSDLLRFDFSHFQPLSEDEVKKVEDLVNQKIWQNDLVTKDELPKDEAIARGAIAFFGEKYGSKVRVVSVGDYSTELCGGTHVNQSGDIGLFKIASEAGIAAGVRRVIAYTSAAAFEFLRNQFIELKKIRVQLRASSSDEITGKIEKLLASEKTLKRQIEQLQAKSANNEIDEIISRSESVATTKIIIELCNSDPDCIKRLRELADAVKQKVSDSVIILGMRELDSGRGTLLICVGPAAPKEIQAQELLKHLLPIIEGKGGGKSDQAQASGKLSEQLPAALEKGRELVKSILHSSRS